MAQDWEVPPEWQQAKPLDAAQLTAAQELRPLSTGEILDRTFSIYRSRFSLFAGLAVLAAAVSLVLNLLQLLVHHIVLVHYGLRAAASGSQIWSIGAFVVLVPASAIVYASSVFALCEIYLGRPIDVKTALKATISGPWLRYVGISLWWGWSAIWLFLLLFIPGFVMVRLGMSGGNMLLTGLGGLLFFAGFLAGFVYGVIAYIRNSVAIPAALMEGSGVRASMRRSKTLAKGTKGRIFVVLLIAGVLYLVAGAIEAPILILIARTPFAEHVLAQGAILLITFVANTLISPVGLIGLTLVYFDQRVRHEAFDLLVMMGPDAPSTEPEPLVWPPPVTEAPVWPPPPTPSTGAWPPPPPPHAIVTETITAAPITAEPIVAEPIVAEPPAVERPVIGLSDLADDEKLL
jgi:hypothetical protein